MFLQFVSILANAKIHSSNEWFDDVKHIEDYSDVNLLLAIQVILPKSDSKDIVDRPTKRPLREVMSDFDSIKSDLNLINFVEELLSVERMTKYAIGQDSQLHSSIEKIKSNIREKNSSKVKLLQDFVQRNFHPVGSDIAPAIPPDHNSKPEFLSDLKDEKLIEMSIKLNETWKELSRQTVKIENGGVSTLLDLPHLFIIPGGRFREYYYWDTYWILEGLLVSGMNVTASNIVKNFISIINTYGYIPNGTRKYYLYRSEPPYFTMMLLKLLDIENNKYNDLVLGEGLKAALKEYEFWEKNRKIELKDKDGKKHSLNLYYARTNYPRPESFSEDYFTFEKQDKRDEETIYTNLKSGAESGWDFSCRWLTDPTSIDTIRASEQIPVDLNAILYKNEVILSVLLKRNNQSALAEKFHKKSVKRKEAMNAILWNDKTGSWNDYLYLKNKFVDDRFYFSNIMPLIYGVSPPSGKCTNYDILKKYSQELFGYIGGVPVSGEAKPVSTQQWDFPNAWAPHQHMIVEYLLSIEEEEMAFHCAKSFFNAVYESYKQEKTFFEKYSCEKLGSKGGGGEYELQTGFGWTNGTILSFIQRFGDELMEDYPFSEKLAFILDILNSKVKEKAANDESTIIRGLNNQIIVSFKSG